MAWLRAVYFLDQNHGWVAGSGGTLLLTSDGGASWKKTSIGKDDLRDVYFSDEQVGWLLAQRDQFKLKPNEPGSYLLTTNDGGATWQHVFLNTPDADTRFARLVFSDPQHGWVFGETGALFATNDGGAHWTPQTTASRHLLLGGAVANNGRGFLVGAGSTVLQSDNYGVTWRPVSLRIDVRARLSAVAAFGNRVWAVGGNQIFRSVDGGHTWAAHPPLSAADLFDIKFVDAQEGWAVGTHGTLLHTTDGGLHWTMQPHQTSAALERLFILDRDNVWVVGFGGTILKLGNITPPQLKN